MGFSFWHLIILLIVVVVIFGTKRLRSAGEDLGEAVKGFKRGMRDDDDSNSTSNSNEPPKAP